MRTSPDRIVICSGAAHALRLLARVLGTAGPWAVEAYGLPFHRGLLAEAGVVTVPVAVDEDGARVAEIPAPRRPCCSPPPTSSPPAGRCTPSAGPAVLEWARTCGGLVVEDDYDGEFRYDRRPVGAVQGLDPERTVLIGSVSKSLSPALRIGWMCLRPRSSTGSSRRRASASRTPPRPSSSPSPTSSRPAGTTGTSGGCASGTGRAATG